MAATVVETIAMAFGVAWAYIIRQLDENKIELTVRMNKSIINIKTKPDACQMKNGM